MIVKTNNGFKVALTNMVAIGKEVQCVIGSQMCGWKYGTEWTKDKCAVYNNWQH